MMFLLLLMFTRYAAKGDDTSNYYVIEMPEDDPPRAFRSPLRVYWNVPTMQCLSRKVQFNMEEYGVVQNQGDSFRGESIAILYDPGLFPALLKNESSGELRFRNGGVPQEGNMTVHVEAFRSVLEQSIPDKNFSGVGIIDFESWRPTFRQNFGVLVPYKDVSYEVERKLHWWWMDDWIQAEAKQRFEAAARSFMQTSLSLAKQLRPNALWGYYGFPYCFNMAGNHLVERCADNVPQENDNITWLWQESTALYPSVYSSKNLSTSQLAALIRGRVGEAARVARDAPILPYFWFRYRDGDFMSEVDLLAALKAFYNSNASGFIIWGSSNDVNTLDKCLKLQKYVQSTLGPAIAKYTKARTREEDEMLEATTEIDQTTNSDNTISDTNALSMDLNDPIAQSSVVNTKFIPIDPEFPWEPPANYSQEISQYVEEELMKRDGYNETKLENNLTTLNQSLLLEIVMNNILNTILDPAKSANITETTILNYMKDYESNNNSKLIDDTIVERTKNINNITSIPAYITTTERNDTNSITTIVPLENLKSSYIIVSNEPTESIIISTKQTQTKENTKEVNFLTTESNINTDATTESDYRYTGQNTKVNDPFISGEMIIAPNNIIVNSNDVTTEILQFILNATSILDNSVMMYDERTVTDYEEVYPSSTPTIDNELNLTTESIDLLKKAKKESISTTNEHQELNSNDSPLSGAAETEQVVIYIS